MINVLNEQGVSFQIDINRFFEVNNNQYLIYNTNEKDEAGYVKLYLSKNVNGFFVKVDDDNEWNLVKDLIKIIIKEINENNLSSVLDLDYKRLENQTIISARNFKLSEQVSTILSSNKKVFEVVMPSVKEEIIASSEQIVEDIKPFSLEANDDEEPKSYEELLAQIKGFKEEISKEIVVETTNKELIEPNNTVSDELEKEIVVTNVSSEPKVIAEIDALEVLLGQKKSDELVTSNIVLEEPKKEQPIVNDDLILDDRIKNLEKKIEEYEIKLSKIREILK
jgi:hypothetical protein